MICFAGGEVSASEDPESSRIWFTKEKGDDGGYVLFSTRTSPRENTMTHILTKLTAQSRAERQRKVAEADMTVAPHQATALALVLALSTTLTGAQNELHEVRVVLLQLLLQLLLRCCCCCCSCSSSCSSS